MASRLESQSESKTEPQSDSMIESQFLFIEGHKRFGTLTTISIKSIDECQTIPWIGNRYYVDSIENQLKETGQKITQYRLYLPNRRFMDRTRCLTYLLQIKDTLQTYKPKRFQIGTLMIVKTGSILMILMTG